jgi:hypothetical protein
MRINKNTIFRNMNNLPPPIPSRASSLTNAKAEVEAPPPLQAPPVMPPPLMSKSASLPPPLVSYQYQQTGLIANKSKIPTLLIGLVITVAVCVGGYFYWQHKNSNNSKAMPDMSAEELANLTKKNYNSQLGSESVISQSVSTADSDENLKAAIRDGFSDEATAWLKQHPAAAKCVEEMVEANQKQQKKEGYEPSTSSETYGDFISTCNKKFKVFESIIKPKKMLGDIKDDNPNARPRSIEERKNKDAKKAWQDSSGFVHFPDGSITNTPVD